MLHSLSSHQCWKINVQILNIIYDYIYELLQSLIDRIKYFYVISGQYYRNITYCITFSIDCPNLLYHDQTQNKFFSLDILFEKNFVVLYTIFLHTFDCSYWRFISKICVVYKRHNIGQSNLHWICTYLGISIDTSTMYNIVSTAIIFWKYNIKTTSTFMECAN